MGVMRGRSGSIANVNEDGAQDVLLRDRHSPLLVVPFHRDITESTVAVADLVIDSYTINVADSTGMVAGQYLSCFSINGNRFFRAYVTNVLNNVITVDTPIDFAFSIGDVVAAGSTDMNVDGSSTPVSFHLRQPEPGLSITGHVTRIILIMETTTATGWNDFGDLTATNFKGLVLRKTDGAKVNIWNCKSNSELAGVMFDFDPIDQTKFNVYGIKGRQTFAGQSKMGAVIEIGPGEDLELIVQDNLTGLVKFRATAQGHIKVND